MEEPKEYTRRGFLALMLGKGTEAITDSVKAKISKKVQRTEIRPPGALDEISFLTACTRCDDCLTACPHDVIRKMGPDAGLAFKTPYLSFEKGGCKWCEGFPCIEACPTDALGLQGATLPIKAAATLQINLEHCLVNQGQYCDYCKSACPDTIATAITLERRKAPEVDLSKCVGCGECVHICVSQTGSVFKLEPV